MNAPGEYHVKEMGRVVGYAKQVNHEPLVLIQPFELKLINDTDRNYAADATNKRSVNGNVYTLGGGDCQLGVKESEDSHTFKP